VQAADERLAARLTPDRLSAVLAGVPDAWLVDAVAGAEFATADEARARYLQYLGARLAGPRPFVEEAVQARERLLREPPRPLSARR
jgi:hypothetical protein